MGIRDYLRRRHERESAIPAAYIEPAGDEQSHGAEPQRSGLGPDDGPGRAGEELPTAMELPGSDASELARMLVRAASDGTPQISGATHQVDGAEGVSREIVGLLAGAGAVSESGTEIRLAPPEAEALLQRVREQLEQLRVDETADDDADPPPSS